MANIPVATSKRLVSSVPKFKRILSHARERDVNESDKYRNYKGPLWVHAQVVAAPFSPLFSKWVPGGLWRQSALACPERTHQVTGDQALNQANRRLN